MTGKIELKRIQFVDEEYGKREALDKYKISFLNFDGDEPIRVIVRGRIVNSTDDARAKPWKQKIAREIMKVRKGVQDPKILYAISVTMHFHPETHQKQKLDAENYLKPILDATAAGLFEDHKTPEELHSFHYDDSNFENVYFDKMWVMEKQHELIIITISKTAKSETRHRFDSVRGL